MKNKMNLVCGIYVPFTYHPPIAIAEFLSILGTNLFHQNHSTKCYTVFSYGQSPQSHVIFMPCTWCKCLSIPSKYLVSFQIIQCFFSACLYPEMVVFLFVCIYPCTSQLFRSPTPHGWSVGLYSLVVHQTHPMEPSLYLWTITIEYLFLYLLTST